MRNRHRKHTTINFVWRCFLDCFCLLLQSRCRSDAASKNDVSGWIVYRLDSKLDACAGPTAFFEEEAQDEKVAEVAAKWLGERHLAWFF